MASKKYAEMSRAERRVAIAKDVIKHIQAGRLNVADSMGYVVHEDESWVGLRRIYRIARENDKLAAETMKQECTVCARGAMMLCKVAKYNNHKFDLEYGVCCHQTWEALQDAFTSSQLNMIEEAFEVNIKSEGEWFEQIPRAEDRLLAIMQNIVDNNGTFKPKVAYVVV